MIITCSCGVKNRLPKIPLQRSRCGKCKHVFTIPELTRATIEPPPPRESMADVLAAMLGQMGAQPGGESFDIGGLDLDTKTDEDLIEVLLGKKDKIMGAFAEKLAPVREATVEAVASRRACFPKLRHATRGQAETQLHDVLINGMAKDKSTIHTYKCPACDGWHVGHSTRNVI